MAIKLKREQLERIVIEELSRYIAEQLNEAPPSRGTVLDDEEPTGIPDEDDVPNQPGPVEEPPSMDEPEMTGDIEGEPNELPGDEDEADLDLDALEAGEEPPSEEADGTVAGELSGKTIENITVDEDSQVMPGATEVVLTFREHPDALRLLITKSGQIKYFYRGLHNSLDSMVSPVPDDDAPEDQDDMGDVGLDDLGDDDVEEMPPLGDDDMPPAPEEPSAEEELP